ncbi:MAG: hypothetical protein EBZ59_12370, partial [Planctomycetia bacterium]|nr:hypothetical protein [Planctomycetia bacterium]
MTRRTLRMAGTRLVGRALVVAAAGCAAPALPWLGAARAQEAAEGDNVAASGITMADPSKAPWIKFEAAIEKNYREPLKQGGKFENTARDYVEKTVVPQLALEDNRAIIERVRKRLIAVAGQRLHRLQGGRRRVLERLVVGDPAEEQLAHPLPHALDDGTVVFQGELGH